MLKSDYAKAVLANLKIDATESDVDFILRWAACENSNTANNPLNVTQPDDATNTPGYETTDEGITATTAQIQNGNYPVLIEALTSGAPENFNLSSELSTWSGGTYSTVYTAPPADGDVIGYTAPPTPEPEDGTAGIGSIATVKPGENSQAVRNLQGLLVANGHMVSIDGDYGDLTGLAVKEFQTHENLTSDGTVNADTWSKLLGV